MKILPHKKFVILKYIGYSSLEIHKSLQGGLSRAARRTKIMSKSR